MVFLYALLITGPIYHLTPFLVPPARLLSWILFEVIGWLRYYLWDGIREEATDIDLEWNGPAPLTPLTKKYIKHHVRGV